MHTRLAVRLVRGVIIGSAWLATGACSDQPRVRCAAARGNFAATYRLISGTGDCANHKGDVLAVQTYNGSNSDKTPNWDDATMAIQPNAVTGLVQAAGAAMVSDPNPENKPYALGRFATAEPGPDEFCVAPELSALRVQLPAVPAAGDGMGGMTSALPEADVEYRWTNVRVYVTAAANGTMFTANLALREGSCTAEYAVEALYPMISCLVPPPPPPMEPAVDTDAGDNEGAVSEAGSNDDGGSNDAASGDAESPATDAAMTSAEDAGASSDAGGMSAEPPAPVLDETLCSPFADLARGRPLGSGISPDVLTRCDPDLQMCVLAKAPPARR